MCQRQTKIHYEEMSNQNTFRGVSNVLKKKKKFSIEMPNNYIGYHVLGTWFYVNENLTL